MGAVEREGASDGQRSAFSLPSEAAAQWDPRRVEIHDIACRAICANA
jgi:hypothetical protein